MPFKYTRVQWRNTPWARRSKVHIILHGSVSSGWVHTYCGRTLDHPTTPIEPRDDADRPTCLLCLNLEQTGRLLPIDVEDD